MPADPLPLSRELAAAAWQTLDEIADMGQLDDSQRERLLQAWEQRLDARLRPIVEERDRLREALTECRRVAASYEADIGVVAVVDAALKGATPPA